MRATLAFLVCVGLAIAKPVKKPHSDLPACAVSCLAGIDTAVCSTKTRSDVGCFCNKDFNTELFSCVESQCTGKDSALVLPQLASFGCSMKVSSVLSSAGYPHATSTHKPSTTKPGHATHTSTHSSGHNTSSARRPTPSLTTSHHETTHSGSAPAHSHSGTAPASIHRPSASKSAPAHSHSETIPASIHKPSASKSVHRPSASETLPHMSTHKRSEISESATHTAAPSVHGHSSEPATHRTETHLPSATFSVIPLPGPSHSAPHASFSLSVPSPSRSMSLPHGHSHSASRTASGSAHVPSASKSASHVGSHSHAHSASRTGSLSMQRPSHTASVSVIRPSSVAHSRSHSASEHESRSASASGDHSRPPIATPTSTVTVAPTTIPAFPGTSLPDQSSIPPSAVAAENAATSRVTPSIVTLVIIAVAAALF